jgi:mannose-1-phosphate guanylyltransferase/mannose-1-phosphate guanylyltransferase/mannose-6-phosphate isomerase
MSELSPRRKIYPVLLSGGAGVRLWPMSRERFPKQLLSLVSEHSMIQETARRVADKEDFAPALVVCNEEHRFVIAEQLRQLHLPAAEIILEPVGRNTAPAVAVAALRVAALDPDGLMLVLPADHLIRNQPAFRKVVTRAAEVATAGHLVTFGIVPTAPETGYGYIRRGPALPGRTDSYRVAAFVEKPPRAQAEQYLADGAHYWNSGMFLFPVALVLAELERLAPEILAAARRAIAGGKSDLDFFRLAPGPFTEAPSISIDYAVMERTAAAAVVPADIGWTDVGAWAALWEVADKDSDGNVHIGDVLSRSSRNCYIRSEGMLTATVGLDDTIVVVTDDAVLVANRDRVDEIKPLVEEMKRVGRDEPISHRRVHRPWGFYQSLHGGDRFQVKLLTVNPGAKLSLQLHYHRAEHWVVVNGTARVTRGSEEILLRENESMFIPLGIPHRLENPGKLPLNLIEVQSGPYLGEDDIVRLDDTYGRG